MSGKSLTFGSDQIQNGQLISDELNGTIFLNAENEKSLISRKRCEVERFFDKSFDPQGICRVLWQL